MNTPSYINSINRRYLTGLSREHAYRGDLPNFVLLKKYIPIGYIEAKDIGVYLKKQPLFTSPIPLSVHQNLLF